MPFGIRVWSTSPGPARQPSAGRPRRGQHGLRELVELADMPERERPQERSQHRQRRHPMAQHLAGRTRHDGGPAAVGDEEHRAAGHAVDDDAAEEADDEKRNGGRGQEEPEAAGPGAELDGQQGQRGVPEAVTQEGDGRGRDEATNGPPASERG